MTLLKWHARPARQTALSMVSAIAAIPAILAFSGSGAAQDMGSPGSCMAAISATIGNPQRPIEGASAVAPNRLTGEFDGAIAAHVVDVELPIFSPTDPSVQSGVVNFGDVVRLVRISDTDPPAPRPDAPPLAAPQAVEGPTQEVPQLPPASTVGGSAGLSLPPSIDSQASQIGNGDDQALSTGPEAAPERTADGSLPFAKWVLVRDFQTSQDLGWVDATGLKCRGRPLRGVANDPLNWSLWNNALDVRAVARTAGTDDQPGSIQAFRGPRETTCDETCFTIGQFEVYYVHDFRNGRALLSNDFAVGAGSVMIGWVNLSDLIIWATSLGMRPSDALARTIDVEGQSSNTDTRPGYICGWSTPDVSQPTQLTSLDEEARPEECNPIIGGNSWYTIPDRLLYLADEQGTYKVAGIGNSLREESGSEERIITPDDFSPIDLSSLETLKVVDVFFVVDGTESMETAIRAIKGGAGQRGLVESIIDRLQARFDQGTAIRFGFRVFRDSSTAENAFNNGTGVDEGLPLERLPPDKCLSLDADTTAISRRIFDNAFQDVRVRSVLRSPGEPNEDFAENLLGGLNQAIDDIAGCPETLKVVFVLGDHGYSETRQGWRNQPVFTNSQIVEKFRSRFIRPTDDGVDGGLLLYFIQMPRTYDSASTEDGRRWYRNSYEDFKQRAREITRGVYAGTVAAATAENDNIFTLTELNDRGDEIVGSVINALEEYAQPIATETVVTRVTAGESVEQVINRLMQRDDMPVLLLDTLRARACELVGPTRCREAAVQLVSEFYLSPQDNIVPEVQITGGQLAEWILFLNAFREYDSRSPNARTQLVTSIRQVAATILGLQDAQAVDTSISLGEIMQRILIVPSDFRSPLLGYTIDSLADPRFVPDCEIGLLTQWASTIRRVFQMVQRGREPVFTTEPIDPSRCLGISDYARENLRVVVGNDIQSVELGSRWNKDPEKDYSYGHFVDSFDTNVYWIPLRYLP